jgi:predicted aldo/keto reductase-like oxidoreductase
MRYRSMTSTGDSLSILGYGAMRLPQKGGRIDEQRAARQLLSAIDRGVNYVDTAVPYHMGASEPFLGRTLRDGYREKVHLATKLPHWHVRTREDMDTALGSQLDRLRTDRIDYYLVHNLAVLSWNRLKEGGFEDFVRKTKADGRIRHIGFSSHCGRDDFQRILDDFPWEFCQIQLNYLDEESQAGLAGLEYAHARGVGVVVMEPLRGGGLGQARSPEVRSLWDTAPVKRTPAEWALRWVWNRPEVSVVLSGMNEEAHIDENLRVAGEARPESLSEIEIALISSVRDAWRRTLKVGCTGCRYCMPCPQGVDIAGCFLSYNNAHMGGVGILGSRAISYISIVGGAFSKASPGYASRCIQCGKCATACPQHIEIPRLLMEVKRDFEGPVFPFMKAVVGAFERFDRRRSMRPARP